MISIIAPFLIVTPSLIYALISLWCGHKFFRENRLRRAATSGIDPTGNTNELPPSVTILKPVKGMDAESFENFASFCRQDYPSPWQMVFAVADATDPVIPVIERVQREFPDADVELVIDDRIYGPNYKVCNLMNAWPKAKHEVVIICDSDIRAGARYLREVCAPFSEPRVGLVTSLYRSPGVRGAATAVEAMGFTAEMVPNVMVALHLEGLSFALGASMAVRRQALEKIGGFPALVDYLADDYQLGNKIHLAGYQLHLSDYFVESIMHRESLRSVFSRQLRWARTMRVSRPGGYLASGITQPFPAAVAALALSRFSATGFIAVVLLYLVRASVASIYSRLYLKDGILPRWLWLLQLRDLLAFGTWALSFTGNRVRWRGHLYRLLPGGRMAEIKGD